MMALERQRGVERNFWSIFPSSENVIHSNDVRIIFNGRVIGASNNISIVFNNESYFYRYIGGTEIRLGGTSITGTMEKAVVDLAELTLSGNVMFSSKLGLDLNNIATYILNRSEIVVKIVKMKKINKKEILEIILKDCVFDKMSIVSNIGATIFISGSFKANEVYIRKDKL